MIFQRDRVHKFICSDAAGSSSAVDNAAVGNAAVAVDTAGSGKSALMEERLVALNAFDCQAEHLAVH